MTIQFQYDDLPLSPIFLDFLARWMDGSVFATQPWPDQISEDLSNNRALLESAESNLARISITQTGQQTIDDVYRWFHQFMTGDTSSLAEVHKRFTFLAIVGIPRSGGSYLTTEAFAALGYRPELVPAGIAHDGFPEARPFHLRGVNSWVDTLMRTSEYLVMIERYFSNAGGALTVVPKKLTKAAYAGGFFREILGQSAEYLVTVRHPIACCVSTWDKSGGRPPDGKFKVRSAIERWVMRDLCLTGVPVEEFPEMDYFSAYVRYWEQYHLNLALSGLIARRKLTVVPYGKENMEQMATQLHQRFGSAKSASSFFSSPRRDAEYPDLIERSEAAFDRVEAAWQAVGLTFPRPALAVCS